jgi:hypothetical protein
VEQGFLAAAGIPAFANGDLLSRGSHEAVTVRRAFLPIVDNE